MKHLGLYILMLFLLAACSSDDIPEFAKPDEGGMDAAKMYKVELNLMGDSTDFNKLLDNDSRSKPVLNDVYLIANYDKEESKQKRLKINVYSQTSTTTGELNGIIAFYINKTASGNVALSNGSNSIELAPDELCMISSVPNTGVNLTSLANQTPGNKSAYGQYGDNLFRSHRLFFKYEKKWKSEKFIIDIDIMTNNVYTAEIDTKEDFLLFRNNLWKPLTIELDRYTISVVANIAMVDWRNHVFLPDGLREVDASVFSSYMKGTTLKDWSVKQFMSGAPSSFSLFNDIKTPPQGTSLITLSESAIPFNECKVARRDASPWELWGAINSVGVMHKGDEGESFIFPMTKSFDASKEKKTNEIENSAIYYTFYCNRTSVDIGGQQYTYYPNKTLRVPFGDLGIETLEPNTKYEILTIITIWDFQRAMRTDLGFPKSASAGTRAQSDPIFGEVVDIPYKVVVRKIEDKNTKMN